MSKADAGVGAGVAQEQCWSKTGARLEQKLELEAGARPTIGVESLMLKPLPELPLNTRSTHACMRQVAATHAGRGGRHACMHACACVSSWHVEVAVSGSSLVPNLMPEYAAYL